MSKCQKTWRKISTELALKHGQSARKTWSGSKMSSITRQQTLNESQKTRRRPLGSAIRPTKRWVCFPEKLCAVVAIVMEVWARGAMGEKVISGSQQERGAKSTGSTSCCFASKIDLHRLHKIISDINFIKKPKRWTALIDSPTITQTFHHLLQQRPLADSSARHNEQLSSLP